MINYIMRLIRLSTTDNNLYFNNNIQADINLSPKSKICCLNVNFEKAQNELIVNDTNGIVRVNIDSDSYNYDITPNTYNLQNYRDLLMDMRNSLQEKMDIGEFGTGYVGKAIGTLWDVSKDGDTLETRIDTDQQPLIDPIQDAIAGDPPDYEQNNFTTVAGNYTNDDLNQPAELFSESYNFPTSLNTATSNLFQGTKRCCIFTMSLKEINAGSVGGYFGFMKNPKTTDRSDLANYYLAIEFTNNASAYTLFFGGVSTPLAIGNASNDDFLMFRFTDNQLQCRIFNAGNPNGFDAFSRVEVESDAIYPVLYLESPNNVSNRVVIENLSIIPNVKSDDAFSGTETPALTSVYNIPQQKLNDTASWSVELTPDVGKFLGYTAYVKNLTRADFVWRSENGIILYDNSENYIVELVNIDLQSYDGLKSQEQRKNILMNIVNSRTRNEADVAFVSTFPVWLNIDNAYESFIRNIKARIVHSDYRLVKAVGEANITLLIKDEDE